MKKGEAITLAQGPASWYPVRITYSGEEIESYHCYGVQIPQIPIDPVTGREIRTRHGLTTGENARWYRHELRRAEKNARTLARRLGLPHFRWVGAIRGGELG